jgi:pimeloyl-ACP methyl ester carboxylesterase
MCSGSAACVSGEFHPVAPVLADCFSTFPQQSGNIAQSPRYIACRNLHPTIAHRRPFRASGGKRIREDVEMSGTYREGEASDENFVLALHSSASSGAQWTKLATRLEQEARVVAPDLWGYGATPTWNSQRPMTLADEAALALAAMDAHHQDAFDLVGHSFGGALALHIARHHPQRVRSLVLIEPVALHLLATGPTVVRSRDAFREVHGVGAVVGEAVDRNEFERGMEHFIDYWNGAGAWQRMSPEARAAMAVRLPQVKHDFGALGSEPGDFDALRAVRCPVLLLRGSLSPWPVRILAAVLAGSLGRAELATLADAGHMLPITHAGKCNELIRWHFLNAGKALPGRAA